MNIINNKYKLIEKIGEGCFGTIYKGQNIRTHEEVAIKIEPIENQTKLLKNESIIYQYLNNSVGIPVVKWYGKDEINYYMVLNLLGNSLQKLKDKIGVFSLRATLQIGIQIINLLKTIHEKGLVHRDIKPDNFLFGLNDKKTQLYIIDFGFCRSFINNDTNNHISMKKNSNLIGSQTYASINAHKYDELSRRDDLESLCYMLLYFLFGNLEWQYLVSNNSDSGKEKNMQIQKLKLNIIDNHNKNIPDVFINYLTYVRQLNFEETPNYVFLIDMLNKELDKL
jgi:serine/threonine protein kinase